MTAAEITTGARREMRLIAQLRTAYGFSEIEARDFIRFCRGAFDG